MIGPRETSAKIGTGTAEDVVLDDVDGKAVGIDIKPLGGGIAKFGRSLEISAM